jgi:hypothetical protein
LDHVLGVNAAGEALADATAGNGDKAVQILVYKLPCRFLVAGAPRGDGVGHDECSTLVLMTSS